MRSILLRARRSFLSTTTLAAVAAVLSCALAARASELSLIDSLYARAEREYAEGDFGEAAPAYADVIARIEGRSGPEVGYLEDRARRARFLLGRALEEESRWDEAKDAYERSLEELPVIADAVRLRIARCLAEEENYGRAVETLRSVVDAPERTTLYASAVEQLAGVHREAGDYDVAVQWYRVLLSELPGYDDQARLRYKTGLALKERGDEAAAAERFAEVVEEYPRSRHARDAFGEGRIISRAFTDRYHQGLILYNWRRYREAVEFFTYYLRYNDQGENRPQATYFRARSHQRTGDYWRAARDYEEAVEFGPESEYFDLAWKRLAYCVRVTGRIDESLAMYEEYASVYPESGTAPDMLWEKGRLLEEERRWAEAIAEYEEMARRYPASEKARDARFRAALCLYKLERYEEADAAFADLPVAGDGNESARAFFWAGKCRAALHEWEAAAARYQDAVRAAPDSYYGRRAAYRLRQGQRPTAYARGARAGVATSEEALELGGHTQLGFPFRRVSGLQDFAAWLAEWYHLVYVPGERIELARMLRKEPAFLRADAFLLLHMPDEAGRELSHLEDMYGSDPRMLDILIGYYEAMGLHSRGIRLAEWILELSPADTISDAPPYLRRKICPDHFDAVVRNECSRYGIDPALYYSLMRQESLFEPEAVSWVGARGLSQIMPGTGLWIARRLGVRGFRTKDLLDPELNIRFGAYYLAEQLEDFEGDIMRALAAYNGGPHNVDRWWDYGGGRDTDVFVEDIGYAQTYDYVRRVFLYGEFYRELGSGG
ncbi:MAG: transglycosylase SLT domain-containing protein [Candidatus Eisenbacteria bacterium]|nr:transglycosylase SLT domain-containing protein [Candidatus Eisenbacteria bacterium]